MDLTDYGLYIAYLIHDLHIGEPVNKYILQMVGQKLPIPESIKSSLNSLNLSIDDEFTIYYESKEPERDYTIYE